LYWTSKCQIRSPRRTHAWIESFVLFSELDLSGLSLDVPIAVETHVDETVIVNDSPPSMFLFASV